jgi:hypothetical protein
MELRRVGLFSLSLGCTQRAPYPAASFIKEKKLLFF